jgi:S1-C subfamily serine protease
MRLLLNFVLLTLLATVSTFAQGRAAKSPGEIARAQSPAIVVIEALDERGSVTGQGSGFIATASGAVITNLHVVRGAASVRVKLSNGDVYKTADLVDVDDQKDIAILKLKGFKMPIVTLGDSDKVEVGDAIIVISSPEGLTNSLSTGVISGMRRLDTHRIFQITAPISQGSSGGALFDASGELIGIVTYVLKSGQNINFAVPINYARGMINEGVKLTLAQLQPSAPQEETRPTRNLLDASKELDDQLAQAARGKLGRTPQAPMFVRPDEALALFYRLVAGIGLYTSKEVSELTRTAAAVKTKDTGEIEEYTIKYLSFHDGLTMSFSKPEHLLTGVELLVAWSLEDLKNTFGDKFRRRTVGAQKLLDFGKTPHGHQLFAVMDGNGNVRSVKFTKAK